MSAVTTNQNQIELVRMLAMEIGVRPAARKLGVNEDTACSWADRYDWNISGKATNGRPHSASTLQANPADVLQSELASHEHGTRLTLAKYAHNASRAIHKSVHPAKWTKEAKDLASVMATVHRQDEGKGQSFSLNVLNINSLSLDQEHTSD